jgi:hypothetical protein
MVAQCRFLRRARRPGQPWETLRPVPTALARASPGTPKGVPPAQPGSPSPTPPRRPAMFSRHEAAVATSASQRPDPDTVPPGTAYVCPISHIPEAVRALRHRARALLTRWGLSRDAVDEAVLVISELATNAINHALPPAEVRLSMPEVDGRRVLRIEVSDTGPAPRPLTSLDRPNPDENGRGLSIVAALSLRHGTHLASGRVTQWADVPAPLHSTRSTTSTAESTSIQAGEGAWQPPTITAAALTQRRR